MNSHIPGRRQEARMCRNVAAMIPPHLQHHLDPRPGNGTQDVRVYNAVTARITELENQNAALQAQVAQLRGQNRVSNELLEARQDVSDTFRVLREGFGGCQLLMKCGRGGCGSSVGRAVVDEEEEEEEEGEDAGAGAGAEAGEGEGEGDEAGAGAGAGASGAGSSAAGGSGGAAVAGGAEEPAMEE